MRRLSHAYVDGELDVMLCLDVEHHLRDCPACTRDVERHRELRALLTGPALYHASPAGLEQRIRAALQPSVRGQTVRWRPPLWMPAVIAASLLLSALAGWGMLWTRPSSEMRLAQEVYSSHVRSLMEKHLVDERSSDRHTVKPWFAGRVDFAPRVADLAEEGFVLVGGRLDFLDNRKAAAVVYRRHKHDINLFSWPTTAPNAEPRTLELQNYHLIYWTDAGLTYWAISDLNEDELAQFVTLIRRQ
jgi:anti-sigma factor RsiW